MVSIAVDRRFTRAHGTLLLAVAIEPREIGRRIARARDRKGWTQLAFALEANVSPSTIQRWEAGKLPPVRELSRIADLLGIETSELVEPDEEATGQSEKIARLEAELSATRATLARIEQKLDEALPSRPRRVRSSG